MKYVRGHYTAKSQAVCVSVLAFISTGNLLGIYSLVFSSVVKSHKKKVNSFVSFWLIFFLANVLSSFVAESRLYEKNT